MMHNRWILTMLILLLLAACANPEDLAEGETVHYNVDYIYGLSFAELAQAAELVAVGEVTGEGNTVNASRSPNNPTKPHSSLYILGQVYYFQVGQILKGSLTQDKIDIVQPQAYLSITGWILSPDFFPPAIEEARKNFPHIPLQVGSRLLIFVSPLSPAIKGDYYSGPIQPWRFDLSDPENITPISEMDGMLRYFPPVSLEAAIELIQNPGPLGTPVPAYPYPK